MHALFYRLSFDVKNMIYESSPLSNINEIKYFLRCFKFRKAQILYIWCNMLNKDKHPSTFYFFHIKEIMFPWAYLIKFIPVSKSIAIQNYLDRKDSSIKLVLYLA